MAHSDLQSVMPICPIFHLVVRNAVKIYPTFIRCVVPNKPEAVSRCLRTFLSRTRMCSSSWSVSEFAYCLEVDNPHIRGVIVPLIVIEIPYIRIVILIVILIYIAILFLLSLTCQGIRCITTTRRPITVFTSSRYFTISQPRRESLTFMTYSIIIQ